MCICILEIHHCSLRNANLLYTISIHSERHFLLHLISLYTYIKSLRLVPVGRPQRYMGRPSLEAEFPQCNIV